MTVAWDGGWTGVERSRAGQATSSHKGWMSEGRHGYTDKFKPSYYGLRAFGWKCRAYQLLEYRGNVRPRPLLVINCSSACGSKLHPGASTSGYGGSCGGHFHAVLVFVFVSTHSSASRDAGIQGRLSQFVSTGILISVNVLCGLSYDADAASVVDYLASINECDRCFF